MSEQPTQQELDTIWCELHERHWYLQKRNRWTVALLGLGIGSTSLCLYLAITFFLAGRIGSGFFDLGLVAFDVGIFRPVIRIHRNSRRVTRDIEKLLS